MGSDWIGEGKGAAGGPFAEALESAPLRWRGGAALPRLLPVWGSGAETDLNTLGSEGVETTGLRGVDCSCTPGGMRVLLSFMSSRWNGGCRLLMWVLVSYKGGGGTRIAAPRGEVGGTRIVVARGIPLSLWGGQ